MVLTRGRIQLNREPREHFTRPAANPLFHSAAEAYGRHVIGVVLTGGECGDGKGMQVITSCGGVGSRPGPDARHARVGHRRGPEFRWMERGPTSGMYS